MNQGASQISESAKHRDDCRGETEAFASSDPHRDLQRELAFARSL
jgi:hypothetical protein